MQLWNQALQQAQSHYPNMRIYNWPAVAQKSWFINDGIHYTTIGYAHRATDIADALGYPFHGVTFRGVTPVECMGGVTFPPISSSS